MDKHKVVYLYAIKLYNDRIIMWAIKRHKVLMHTMPRMNLENMLKEKKPQIVWVYLYEMSRIAKSHRDRN